MIHNPLIQYSRALTTIKDRRLTRRLLKALRWTYPLTQEPNNPAAFNRLLDALIRANGRVLTREQLLDASIGQGAAVTDRAIDVHIASLRKKLTRDYDFIHTVRGVGYAFRVSEGEPLKR